MKCGTFLGLPQNGEVCTVLNTVVIPQVPLFGKVVLSPVVATTVVLVQTVQKS